MTTENDSDKQPRERSKAYPGADLEGCARYTKAIKQNLGKGVYDRDSLARAMGYDKATGAVNPKIAALVYFGFLQRASGGYELTPNASRITDPVDDNERKDELRAAFYRPTLYQELMAKFSPDGNIPAQLPTHLHRFHGITSASSDTAANIFLESGRFAGVIDADGRIVSNGGSASKAATTPDSSDAKTTTAEEKEPVESGADDKTGGPVVVKEGAAPMQRFQFAISEGNTATILVPASLTARDIRIIKKQVELLELQAGVEDPPA